MPARLSVKLTEKEKEAREGLLFLKKKKQKDFYNFARRRPCIPYRLGCSLSWEIETMIQPYWVTTDHPMSLGVGITAYSEQDALKLFRMAWPSAYNILDIRQINDMREVIKTTWRQTWKIGCGAVSGILEDIYIFQTEPYRVSVGYDA